MQNLSNENNCTCHHREEDLERVNEHSDSGCCVVSEYDELGKCCEKGTQ